MITALYYKNLKQLWWLRNIAILGQSLAIVITTHFLAIALPEKPLWLIIGLMGIVNILTWLRLQKQWRVSEGEFFSQLMIDMTALFGLLYYSGGSSNPFTSLFILQVIIAATTLSPLYTWITAGISILFYTALLIWNVDVPAIGHHHMSTMGNDFNLHIHGMWISFMLLTLLVAFFVVRMNSTIRKQNQLLSEAEQIATLGTFATSAAHELGTPLATMAIIAGDISGEEGITLKSQINRCKDIISQITMSANVMRAEAGNKMALREFLNHTIQTWQGFRPSAVLSYDIESTGNIQIIAEKGLMQAITNLLNNAADSSPAAITMTARWTTNHMTLTISDHGSGFPESVLSSIRQPGITSKPEGLGMGLYLSHIIINRLGGNITLKNKTDRNGAIAIIDLPLKGLAV